MNSLLPLSRRQRSVSDHPGSRRHRRAARAVTCALLLSLATAVSSTQPAAAAPTLKGAGNCAKIDLVYRPRSAFPDTALGAPPSPTSGSTSRTRFGAWSTQNGPAAA